MNRSISVVVLLGGIALVFYGISVAGSFCSDIPRIFSDWLTQRTMALLCAGAIFIALGGYGASRRPMYSY